MADLGSSIKGIWLKSMEAIGNAASNIATNTKSKVDEINLVNRRAEILRDFGNKAYALWQKGERFPEELDSQLEELSRLDEQLNEMRAERLAGVKVAEDAKEAAEEAVDEAADEVAEAAEEAGEQLEEAADAVQDAAEDLQETAEDAANSVPVIRVENPEEAEKPAADQLSSAINELFDKVPDAQEVTDKVNGALDSLQEGLQSLSSKVDQELDKLDEKL